MGSGRPLRLRIGGWVTAPQAPRLPDPPPQNPVQPVQPVHAGQESGLLINLKGKHMEDNYVRKINQLFDEASDTWFDIYEAPGVEGRPVRAEVPREDQSYGAVLRILLRKGAVASQETAFRLALETAIRSTAPIVRRAARTGWRNGRRQFVSLREVLGTSDDAVIIPPAPTGAVGNIGAAGDFESWKKLIGMAEHSTAITLALCASFAAPLLASTRRPSFGIVLVGPSRCGKSSAQIAGASAIGFGREQDLPTLNATPAGLLATAIAFNDHALPINEVGSAAASGSDINLTLRKTTYALMNGQDTVRHPSWTGGRTTGTFQILPVFSSEHSPDTWAARSGETRDAGETARLIGVPVLYNGRTTIFDRPPTDLEGVALGQWETEQFCHLRRGLPLNRGHAFPAFIQALIKHRKQSTRRARKLVRAFIEKQTVEGMSAVARDIVAKFGVLYAGGRLAIRFGILPLDAKTLRQALRRACRAALAALPDAKAELDEDIALLRQQLEGSAIINREECSSSRRHVYRSADGFREPQDRGVRFTVRSTAFKAWFRNLARTRALLEWLDAEGLLLNRGGGKQTVRSLEWAQAQPFWPDGTRPRAIVIYLPMGLSTLDYTP